MGLSDGRAGAKRRKEERFGRYSRSLASRVSRRRAAARTLLAQSAVDRFRNSAYDLVIDGESYRSRLKPTLPAETPISASPVHKRPTGRRRNLVT